LIHLELVNVPRDFDVAHFSTLLDEMTRDLAVSYFYIGKPTLESVHAKLISSLATEVDAEEVDGAEKQGLFL